MWWGRMDSNHRVFRNLGYSQAQSTSLPHPLNLLCSGGRARTCDPRINSPMLLPTELHRSKANCTSLLCMQQELNLYRHPQNTQNWSMEPDSNWRGFYPSDLQSAAFDRSAIHA